jgi:hypothetical protein
MFAWYRAISDTKATGVAVFGCCLVVSVCATIVALYGPTRPPINPLEKCVQSADLARTEMCANLTN